MSVRGFPSGAGVLLALASTLLIPHRAEAQVDPGLFNGLRWRNIGPMRASRTRSAAGVAGQP